MRVTSMGQAPEPCQIQCYEMTDDEALTAAVELVGH
jgi:hypothetical protein